MIDSILDSVKKTLGINSDYNHFDAELIMHINSVLLSLTQIGVGATTGYVINDKTETWDDFIGSDRPDLAAVKTYVSLKVKMIFDPPSSSFVFEAMKGQVAEMEWRLGIQAERTVTP